MATFAEDTLERGLTKPPAGTRPGREELPAHPGGRVVIVDARGPVAARHESAASRAAARSRAGRSSRPPCAARIATGIRHSNTLQDRT